MTDTPPAPAAPVLNAVASFEFPQLGAAKVDFDVRQIPDGVRLDFLKGAVRAYIANRLNAAAARHVKDETVAAWAAYEEATKADALQTIVPMPTSPKPADPDYTAVYTRAVEDLKTGTIRKQGETPKARKTKDPLIALVTDVVVRAVYDNERQQNPKYSFFEARKAVGVDGIAYLDAAIEAKVAAGADRAALEKSRDEKYINPAKAMLGMTTTKKQEGLPSIL
jgi:hypothetical protein